MTAAILDRPIRVAIVANNKLFRCTLHTSLNQLPNFKVVAEAENGAEAITMVEFLQPDVVLMDISMPVLDGLEATRVISSRFPDTKIVVLTLDNDQTFANTAFQAGASQFLNKYCGQKKLFQAINRCSAGPLRIVGHPPH
jgi:DNA-binding NarL/FixJ family response regulator